MSPSPETEYTELKDGAPTVADDMLREWRDKKKPEIPPFHKLVDVARAKGRIHIESRTRYPEADTYGFDTYWVHDCCHELVPIALHEPCTLDPEYIYTSPGARRTKKRRIRSVGVLGLDSRTRCVVGALRIFHGVDARGSI